MATVASILGQSEFDLDSTSRSIPGGNPGAAGSVDGSGRTNQDDDSSSPSSSGSPDSTRRIINPADATPSDDDHGSGSGRRSGRSNTRNASSSRASADASSSRRRKESTASDIELGALLVVLHSVLARVLDAKEFVISPEEGTILGDALKRVMKHVTKTVLSPFQEAIAGLIVIVLAIYLPRFIMYSTRTGGPTITVEPPQRVSDVRVKVG